MRPGPRDLFSGRRVHWLFLACRMAQYVWDEDTWDVLGRRILERVRDSGVLSLLPMALAVRVGWGLFARVGTRPPI
jgi:hypothetical protein